MFDVVRQYREALPVSIVAHLVLVGLMVVGVRIGTSGPTMPDPGTAPIQAEAVDAQEVEAAVKRLEEQERADEREAVRRQRELEQELAKLQEQREREAQELQQQESEQQEVSQQLQELQAERERLAEERERLEAEREREAEQLEQLEAARSSEAEQLEELARQRREAAEAEEEARREAERAREEAEQARREAELARKAREEAEARAEEERKAREEAERAAAEKAEQERLSDLRGRYIAAIKQVVKRNWRPPADYQRQGQQANVLVTQIPSGDVIAVNIQSCSGSEAFCKSVEEAVNRASPLPTAPEPDVFDREIEFIFKPDTE